MLKGKGSFILIAFFSFILDQVSKLLIDRSLFPGESRVIINGFLDITYAKNTGAAFGLFSQSISPLKPILFYLFSIVAIAVIIYYILRFPARERGIQLALALIFAGALGNFLDRLRLGYVIDFIDIHLKGYHWPTFNIADSVICIGVGILIYKMITAPSEEKKEDASDII
ncbi:MAG: signal peptidase II [Acidobacteria bacterium]|nr:signal peptidase II [Acidobacteriota bacterium]